MPRKTIAQSAWFRGIATISWCVALLGGCAGAQAPRRQPEVTARDGRALAAVRVALKPQGLSIERVDARGRVLATRISAGGSGDDLGRGYAVATDEDGTEVLLVSYERGRQDTVLSIRRSRLGHVLWSRSVEGRCAVLDAQGDPIAGGCTTGSVLAAADVHSASCLPCRTRSEP